MTPATTLTIREIRRILFETEKYAVIGDEEYTNKEARDFLYEKRDQDASVGFIDNGSHVLIWNI